MLSPPNTIYVDECGTPSFTDVGNSCKDRGYVVAASLIPELERSNILEILPRDTNGSALKASSREMSPTIAAEFIKRVLNTSVEIALVLLDTGSKQNHKLASQVAELSKRGRQASGAPQINPRVLMYLITVNHAIVQVWSHSAIRHRQELTFFNVVMDSFSVSTNDRGLLQKEFPSIFAEQKVSVGSIRWESEDQEPLLLVSDIFAGICRRQLTHQDVGEAYSVIHAAMESGRIGFQDGIEVPTSYGESSEA